ncbi:MAG: error-prone DNA polymerase [Planctomycetaceae bacterium]
MRHHDRHHHGRHHGCGYAELHCTTNFSFLQGASHPEELVARAAALGYSAIAVTDRWTLAGVVRAHAAAGECTVGAGSHGTSIGDGAAEGRSGRLMLLIGVTIEVVVAGPGSDASAPPKSVPLVVWVADRAGYANLCRLLTASSMGEADGWQDDRAAVAVARDRSPLPFDLLAGHSAGLLAGVPLASLVHDAVESPARRPDGCGPHPRWQLSELEAVCLPRLRELFGDRLSCLAELSLEGDDAGRLETFGSIADRSRLPLVASGDARYHVRSRMPLFDVLMAVRHGCTVEEVRGRLLTNGERHLQERWRICERFASAPEAVARTVEIAQRCRFSLEELRYDYPHPNLPPGCSAAEHLSSLAWRGARKRYPEGIPDKVRGLLEHELSLVDELGYEAYFLTVFDLVRFARRRGILCQGRGSAANSAICYCLGITSVDPGRMDVLFERFVSRERREAPDIDIDFEHHRREEVIQYVYETYGRHRAAMTAEVIRYRLRSSVRDVAKALGLSLDRITAIADVIDVADGVEQLPARLVEAGLDPSDPTCVRLSILVGQLIGFPRHLGQHVGGMVMSRGDLRDLVPIRPAAMEGRTILEWDKDDLDELGILKVDCLSLGMLTAIHRAFDLVETSGGPRLTLATVPAEDPAVYEMISRADTVGVFQIESRAQMSMLPRLRPRCFYDLVVEVAIVRPGPIQGDMVHPYLRRRSGEDPITYPNDTIRSVLEKTLGVPLFQEQAMRLAVVAAGFTPGEADQLRRAMGAWRRPGVIDEFRRRLIDGMCSRGLSRTFAEQVFGQIRGFGEYGFPESHAASFALLVYVSAWLKRHHPAAFTAALLGSQPMGFYAPAQLVRDAREHGVIVLPVDVNASSWHASLEPCRKTGDVAVRLGLEQVRGLGEMAGRRIEEARRHGAFRSLSALASRGRLDRETLVHLARAGSLASLGLDRRRALWEAMERGDREGERPLFDALCDPVVTGCDAVIGSDTAHQDGAFVMDSEFLPCTSRHEEVIADYRTTGLSLESHPIAFERQRMRRLGIETIADALRMPEGRSVRVAGIVLTRQRPATAKGTIFLTIEDETGPANVVVRPAIWQSADPTARRAASVIVKGRIQRRGPVVHVVAMGIEPLVPADTGRRDDGPLSLLPRMSRDFC